MKERELQNLLRWWPGYEASQMNFKGEQPMGFALFTAASMAMAARDALQVSMKHFIFIIIFVLLITKSIPFNCTIFLIRMHYGIA